MEKIWILKFDDLIYPYRKTVEVPKDLYREYGTDLWFKTPKNKFFITRGDEVIWEE